METIEILKQCTIDGLIIRLPQIQLDRNEYIEVKKSLELIGGSWKGGKIQGFVFKEDPTEYLEQLCSGEKRNLKKEFQFFGTPDLLADRLVELAFELPCLIGAVLEPSAGQGAIIKAIHRQDPDIKVRYCELMDLNLSFLEKYQGKTEFVSKDFLSIEKPNYYSQIIGNPPFSKNQDIDHVYKMYECLEEGGRIATIMSNHWRNTSGKKETEFQQFIERANAYVEEIPAGAFKESGTTISACIVVINKKYDIEPPVSKKAPAKKAEEAITQPPKQKTKLPIKMDESLKKFQDSFNVFTYRYSHSEVFIDFLDYCLLACKWWETERDFSYFEKKYGELYPKLTDMFILLSEASDNDGVGFRDALGDLFMELVSGGRNGQFFTPDNICDLMSLVTCPDFEDGQSILDPACGSSRMLLAAAKRNRKAFFFGCDNDVTCCKMSVLNMILNTMQGEIAHMDSLKMEYHKSWEISYRVYQGNNIPVYRVIENKEDSTLWKMQINSFKNDKNEEPKESVDVNNDSQALQPVVINRKQKVKHNINQLQLEFF